MTGKEQRHHLVPDLVVSQRSSVILITRADQKGQHIVAGGSAATSLVDELCDQLVDPRDRACISDSARSWPRQREWQEPSGFDGGMSVGD